MIGGAQSYVYTATIDSWTRAFETGQSEAVLELCYGAEGVGRWRDRYLNILSRFVDHFGAAGRVAIARCPAQMNILGMHIDYAGMPSLRMAIRGADTVTVARATDQGQVRMRSVTDDGVTFPSLDFDLAQIVPVENVGTREGIMVYAGEVCGRREAETGSVLDAGWGIIPQGGLIFLESYLRDAGRRPGDRSEREAAGIGGMDAFSWSNVSLKGGMSSSSALLISTALAALGSHGLDPVVAVGKEVLVDGLGSSEWLRGTRGGTADHGGMVLGSSGNLVSVGVFPARAAGRAQLPAGYAPVILDSKVPRIYNEVVKEETVAAYSVGTFVIRELLLPDLRGESEFAGLARNFKERIHLLRDITSTNLGVGLRGICRLLAEVPASISLDEVAAQARSQGAESAFQAMFERDIAGKFQHLTGDDPIFLRRRVTYGLAEQDRVERMVDFMAAGRMADVLELIRISHDGDLDQEVDLEQLRRVAERNEGDEEGLGLAEVSGGYGRMTVAYDAVVRRINEFLEVTGGREAGAVQRLGAGWGGNVGGLIRRDFLDGDSATAFRHFLHDEMELTEDPYAILPGEGACLLPAPEQA